MVSTSSPGRILAALGRNSRLWAGRREPLSLTNWRWRTKIRSRRLSLSAEACLELHPAVSRGSLKRLSALDHGDLVSLPHQKTAVEQRATADRQLVEACLARNDGDRGWEQLLAQFSGLVAHVVSRAAEARRLPLASADRDDLVADVFYEVLRNDAAVLRGFAGRSSLAAYLTVIARRVAGRRLQKRPRPARGEASTASSVAVAGAVEPRDSGDAAAAGQRVDDRDQIAALLESLDANEAKIVRMFHIEERSYGEISRLLGIPLGSVGPVLARARAKLRRQAG